MTGSDFLVTQVWSAAAGVAFLCVQPGRILVVSIFELMLWSATGQVDTGVMEEE